jgi:deoxyribodipyrimidine photo-lyase
MGLLVAVQSPVIFKAHPAFAHYSGTAKPGDFLFPQVSGYFNSFSAYWKKCQ